MEENNSGLTNMEKARELFEYEMTAVLLNVRASYGKGEKPKRPEYLDMEVPSAEIDYTAPEIAVTGIEYTAAEEVSSEEFKAEAFEVTAPEITLGNADVKLSPFCVPVSEIKLDKQAFAAVSGKTVPELSVLAAKAELTAGVTEASKAAVKGADIKAQELFDKPAADASDVKTDVSVEIPDVSASFELSKADAPVVTLDEAAKTGLAGRELKPFGIKAVDTPYVRIQSYGTAKSFEPPVFKMTEPVVPKYPEIPDKPDHSAIISDILNSIRQE